jgi:polyferredoxin
VTEALRLEVDAVTSATETSEAMIKDIRNTFSAYSGIDINHQQASSSDILAIILLISLFGFGLMVCFVRSFKKFRFILLIAVAIIMGFIYQSMLSAALIHGWLVNGFPWRSSFPMVLLLILSILIPMLSRKNYYCHYMCPYGAVQEIAGRISPFKKKPLVRMRILHMPVRNLIFGLLLFGLLIGHHPELSLIEPFSSFSIRVVSWGMLAFGILFIIASFFLSKPWCSFCPTGYFLDSCKKCNIIPYKKTKSK